MKLDYSSPKKLFDSISNQIVFNPEMHNGTGYFDDYVYEDIEIVSKTVDENGRKIILIPIEEHGNLVIFQRYTEKEESMWSFEDTTWCFNGPSYFQSLGINNINEKNLHIFIRLAETAGTEKDLNKMAISIREEILRIQTTIDEAKTKNQKEKTMKNQNQTAEANNTNVEETTEVKQAWYKRIIPSSRKGKVMLAAAIVGVGVGVALRSGATE